MYGIFGPLQTDVRLEEPAAVDLEAVTMQFLDRARRSALQRFSGQPISLRGCHTVQRTIPKRVDRGACIGAIIAHVSTSVMDTWAAAAPGPAPKRQAHVLEQMQQVLQDLSDQDMHGYLALTATQCDVYDLDLVQLVAESLDRTTFSRLGRKPDIHWEGTLVRSLQPPVAVLVVSIGF